MRHAGKNGKSGVATERLTARFPSEVLADSDGREFSGVASVFGSDIDAFIPSIIHAGAFLKTLNDSGGRVKILYHHDPTRLIGKPLSMRESDGEGLAVRGRLSDTDDGNEALTLMRDEVLDALSIGFDPIRWEMEQLEDGSAVRHLYEVRLWEFSLVTWGADPQAKVTELHSLSDLPFERLFAFACEQVQSGRIPEAVERDTIQATIEALQRHLQAAEPPADESATWALTDELTLIEAEIKARESAIEVSV